MSSTRTQGQGQRQGSGAWHAQPFVNLSGNCLLYCWRTFLCALSSLHEDIGVACFMTSLVSSFLAAPLPNSALGWQILWLCVCRVCVCVCAHKKRGNSRHCGPRLLHEAPPHVAWRVRIVILIYARDFDKNVPKLAATARTAQKLEAVEGVEGVEGVEVVEEVKGSRTSLGNRISRGIEGFFPNSSTVKLC